MGLLYYNAASVHFQVSGRLRQYEIDRGGPDQSEIVVCRSFLTGCESCRGYLPDRVAFEFLKLIPHARAGDETLWFD
jgi:hypothetical protein